MNKQDKIRKKIFDSFAQNLRLLSKQIPSFKDSGIVDMLKTHELYICPLCYNVFTKDLLNQRLKNPLSIEDIPPKSIGSTHLILTCESCNNKAGHKLDKHLPKHVKSDRFFKENLNSTIDGKFNFDDESYMPVKIETKGNKNLIFHLPELEEYRKEKFDDLRKNWGDKSFTLQLTVPEERIVKLAYLRIGHLLMFNYFGNAYLFEKNIKTIYSQLKSPDDEIIDKILISKKIAKSVREGIYLLTEPKELRMYCVVIKPKVEDIESTVGILIPGPGKQAWESYIDLGKGKYLGQMKFEPVMPVDCLADSRWLMAYFLFFRFH